MLLFRLNQHGETNDYLRMVLDAENCVGKRDLVITRQNAKENIRNVQMINKLNEDTKRCIARTYKVGDYVMVKNVDTTTGVNKKHIPKIKGPYEVKVVLPNDRYVIKDISGFQVTQLPFESVFECKHIKPWTRQSCNWRPCKTIFNNSCNIRKFRKMFFDGR